LSECNYVQSALDFQEGICSKKKAVQEGVRGEPVKQHTEEALVKHGMTDVPVKGIQRQPSKLYKDFFMVDLPQKSAFSLSKESSNSIQYLNILHHDIQSLANKLLELNVLLSAWSPSPDILCFSEHWLQRNQILYLNIDQYKLADSFCRINDKHGGSCIFVSKSIKTREVSSLKSLGRDKILEISAIEIVYFKII
jgi:hypothetical protein